MEIKIDTDTIVKQAKEEINKRITKNIRDTVEEYFADKRVRNFDPKTRDSQPYVYEESQAKKFVQGVISDYVLDDSVQNQIKALVKKEVEEQVKAMVADVVKHLVRRDNFNKTVNDVKVIAAKETNK